MSINCKAPWPSSSHSDSCREWLALRSPTQSWDVRQTCGDPAATVAWTALGLSRAAQAAAQTPGKMNNLKWWHQLFQTINILLYYFGGNFMVWTSQKWTKNQTLSTHIWPFTRCYHRTITLLCSQTAQSKCNSGYTISQKRICFSSIHRLGANIMVSRCLIRDLIVDATC